MTQTPLKKVNTMRWEKRPWHLQTLFLHGHLSMKYMFTSIFLSNTFIFKIDLIYRHVARVTNLSPK